MTDGGEPYDWATDSDPFFVFLGIYVAAFQTIEGILEEIILLEAGFDHRELTLSRLATLNNHERTKEALDGAVNETKFPRLRHHDGWVDRLKRLKTNLDAERHRRNSLLHARFWLRGLEQGLDAMLTDKRRIGGELVLHHDMLTRKKMDEILTEVAHLNFEVGQIHLQLIHYSE